MFRRRRKRLDLVINVSNLDPGNVLSCNRYIKKLLSDDLAQNSKREEQIEDLKSADPQYLTIIDMKANEYEIKRIEGEIAAAERKMKVYTHKIAPLIDNWKATKNPRIINELKMITNNILPNITVFTREIPDDTCRGCNTKFDFDEEKTMMICPGCADVIRVNDFEICEVIGLENKTNSYVSTKNFVKALDAYQGSMNVYPGEEVFDDIKSYCDRMGLNPKTLKSVDVKEILSSTGHSAYYNAVNFILHKLTDKPLPDISSIRDDIISDNRMIDKEFRKFCATGSSINTQKKLYVLLRKHGIPCEKEDFRMPKTPDIDLKYNSYLVKIFDSLGWDYKGII